MTLLEKMDTFVDNRGFRKVLPKLVDAHVEMKREEYKRLLEAEDAYEKGAAAYYAKHGTVGEF